MSDSDQPQLQRPDDQGDPLLRNLVDSANATDLQLGITLQLEGVEVTGTLIAQNAYMTGVAAILNDYQGEVAGIGQAVAELFRPLGDEDLEPDAQWRFYNTRHIHMKDVAVRGGGISTTRSPYWRGRIGAVSGWMLGSSSTSATPD